MDNKQGRPPKTYKSEYIKRGINLAPTETQLRIAKLDFEFYEKVDKLFNQYDNVVEEVHRGLTKDKAYYRLCMILFELKSIYDI